MKNEGQRNFERVICKTCKINFQKYISLFADEGCCSLECRDIAGGL